MHTSIATYRSQLLTISRRHGGIIFAVSSILLWMIAVLSTQTALMGDNIEQSIWAHSFEWGYYKHPPLPSLLLFTAIEFVGPHWWLTNALAGICLIGTAFATYAVAIRLLGLRIGGFAIVIWGLHLTLTWRVSLYNHNTVLILLCSLLTWSVLVAAQERSMRHWLIAGFFAGLALLTKYQALLFIFVLFVGLAKGGYLTIAFHRRGLLIAAVLAALIFAPHVNWLISNDFLPLKYASTQLPTRWSLAGPSVAIGFTLQQIRLFWPSLIAVLVCVIFVRKSINKQALPFPNEEIHYPSNLMWIRFLAFGPFVIVFIIGVLGTGLQNHWGVQALQFFCLGLALWLDQHSDIKLPRFLLIAALLHLSLFITILFTSIQVQKSGWQGKKDISFPAMELTKRTVGDWKTATSCPLTYVVGPSFEAGTISVFSDSYPKVLEGGNPVFSPWIDKADLQHKGALFVAYASSELPEMAIARGSMMVSKASESKRPAVIYWGVVKPEITCIPDQS